MNLSQEEWDELLSLKNAINDNPASVVPHKMERFTELYVKTIEGRGNNTVLTTPSNY